MSQHLKTLNFSGAGKLVITKPKSCGCWRLFYDVCANVISFCHMFSYARFKLLSIDVRYINIISSVANRNISILIFVWLLKTNKSHFRLQYLGNTFPCQGHNLQVKGFVYHLCRMHLGWFDIAQKAIYISDSLLKCLQNLPQRLMSPTVIYMLE